MHEDPHERLVDELAAELGLRRIGWVFTDLVAKDLTKGTVRHSRGNLVCVFCLAYMYLYIQRLSNQSVACKMSRLSIFCLEQIAWSD